MSIFSLINNAHAKGIKIWQEDGQLKIKAPVGALTDEFKDQLRAKKTEIIEFLQQLSLRNDIPAIVPIDRSEYEYLPLSYSQERLWFISQFDPGSTSYSIPVPVVMKGVLDAANLERAFHEVIARHENLRAIFPSRNGTARQEIKESINFTIDVTDISSEPDKALRNDAAKELCSAEANKPFDLETGPLIRCKVIRLADDEHILNFNMHHIISDGWSMGVLLSELKFFLNAFDQGKPAVLPPLPIQFVDYSVWQRNWLENGGVLELQLDYWREKLAGMPESLDLVTDFPRPSVMSTEGATYRFPVDLELSSKMKSVADANGATLYMTLLAALKVLVFRYTRQEDICIGSLLANRQYNETEGLIGMFINTLPMRTQISGTDNYLEVLSKVRSTCLDAYKNQDTPFEKIVDAVQSRRNLAITPLFQIMLVLQNVPMDALNEKIKEFPLESDTSKFDMNVVFTETADGMDGEIEYCTALYNHASISRFASNFVSVCHAVLDYPDHNICEFELLDSDEKQQVLTAFNDTAVDYPLHNCCHTLFVEQAKINSNKIAILNGDAALSYGDLLEKSHDLALYLQSLGTGPDSMVGLCLERSAEMIIGILAILRAGGAYVPLDPTFPDERLKYMLEDSAVAIVITQDQQLDRLASLELSGCELLSLEQHRRQIDDGIEQLKTQGVTLNEEVSPANLAYVIYTSGSTGRPKGVLVEHKALMNRVHWMQDEYQLTTDDVVLQKTPYSFDVSVWEFIWPMVTGATLVFAKPEGHKDIHYMETLINHRGVTTLHFVPSMLTMFLGNCAAECASVTHLFCSGEALNIECVREYRKWFPQAKLHNLYGPTEAAIDVTYFDCSALTSDFVPIGAPIANTQIYILDPENRPQPIGVPGELHIAGVGLARGYLNKPDLTREKFVPNPFTPESRMYKSGDLARWLPDGNIEYLGRLDTQVKIRGFRIETAEIEAQMSACGFIEQSAVVVQGENEEKRLVAFYVVEQAHEKPEGIEAIAAIKAQLQKSLPDYMIPVAFVNVAEIPLTSSGKVDRRALESYEASVESNQEFVAPSGAQEIKLAEIWSVILGVDQDKIGSKDSFFELGGHSLLAVQLMAKLQEHYGYLLPLATLFAAPDISSLAELVSGYQQETFKIVVPIQPNGSKPPVFAIPGAGGNVLSLRQLSVAFGSNQPFYGLQSIGLDGDTDPIDSVEETSRRNIDAIRKIAKQGPYTLIGHSYGGVVAFEMARQLMQENEVVSSLVLIDSVAPIDENQTTKCDDVELISEIYESAASLYEFESNLDQSLLANLSHLQRSEFVADKLTKHGLEMTTRQFSTLFNVLKANAECYNTYHPKPLDQELNVFLFRANQKSNETAGLPQDYGWSRLVKKSLKVHNINANHFSILGHRTATEMIKLVSDCLKEPEGSEESA